MPTRMALTFGRTPGPATVEVDTARCTGCGLCACMLGFPGPLIEHSRKMRAKYGVPAKSKTGLTVVFGYPAIQFQQALMRRFATVHWV